MEIDYSDGEDEAEKQDAELDQERSRQELLSKIARLTDILNEAQQQVKAEKDKRKKKEAAGCQPAHWNGRVRIPEALFHRVVVVLQKDESVTGRRWGREMNGRQSLTKNEP